MPKETNFQKDVDIGESIAILVGTVIGAGILGIPFVVAKSGLGIGIIIMALVIIALTYEKLFLAEICLRTKEKHQLPGYAEKYLGKKGKWLLTFSEVFKYYGAMTAYIIGGGLILAEMFGGSAQSWTFIFFTVGAILIYFGLKLIEKFELWMTIGIFIIVIGISMFAFKEFRIEQTLFFDITHSFTPYGVILLAFAGAVAVPEMRRVLQGQEKDLKKSILIGNSVIFLLYLLFTVTVIGVTGFKTTEIATVGLGQAIGPGVIILANLFALFTMGTSFLTIGLALKNIYNYDYQINKNISWFLALSVPLIVYLLGVDSFIRTLDFIGATAVGLTGILIILMYWQAKKKGDRKPEFSFGMHKLIGLTIIVMFALGIVYAIYNNLSSLLT
ncbi:amino acid permease [Patescibacteria group bacterium]|nr:amino acid permease [Patescibacteria group bacterium]